MIREELSLRNMTKRQGMLIRCTEKHNRTHDVTFAEHPGQL